MTTNRWHDVDRLYHEALTRPAAERAAFLHDACRGDATLLGEVESLLAQTGAASGFLNEAALDAAAKLMTRDTNTSGLGSGDSGLDLIGRQVGVYRVTARLGAGGMGEVYRARDTKLGRDVAIKVLPAMFTADRDRLARFEREARLLATLNHPNIGAIYGLEDSDGVRALVLELVEGETLAERLAQGSGLKVQDALAIARQIAEALDAAHEKGIIHRDLKPANIKVTPQGVVKVLDFGLAKLARPSDSGLQASGLSKAPTISMGGTREGMILGTAAYMSPEQARGQPVDKRTDIWAFGCVLYEMLTGKPPFPGETISDTIAAILEREPGWGALPPQTSPSVRSVLERCLAKDPKRRLRDIGDASMELGRPTGAPARPTSAGPGRRWAWFAGGVAIASAVAFAAFGVWTLRFGPEPPAHQVARFTIPLPAGERLAPIATIAISPNGRYIAFETGRLGSRKLYLRALADEQPRVISTASQNYPFFSTDSEWLGFFEHGKLMKASVRGGPPIGLADSANTRGGSWADDGSIVFAPSARTNLLRLPPAGGAPQAATSLDTKRGETSHRFPAMLPGSKAVLYRAEGSTYADGAIAVASFDSKQERILVPDGGFGPAYLRTGHLAYVQSGNLMVVPFDLNRLEVVGAAKVAMEGVGAFSVADDGSLAYTVEEPVRKDVVWVSLDGHVESLPLPPADYAHPRLSPDGRRLTLSIQKGPDRNLWMYDIQRDALSKFTFAGSNFWPVWAADGSRLFYASNHVGSSWDVVGRPADGTGGETSFVVQPLNEIPRAASPDGRLLAYTQNGADVTNDIWVLPLQAGAQPRPFANTQASEMEPAFSPDSRLIAYVSTESAGVAEVYVRPADRSAGKWQVSSGGGVEPLWAPDGHQLFYRTDLKVLAVDVDSRAGFSVGKPRVLFEGNYVLGTTGGQNYDISRDGHRFLMVRLSTAETEDTPLNIVTNWLEEVKRLAPANK